MGLVTINEIAEALVVHRTSAQRLANKAGWPFKEKGVVGGKVRRYIIEKLPKEVQVAIATKRNADNLLPAVATPTDTPEVRKIFERFSIEEVELKYSMSKKEGSRSQVRTELLIAN